MEKINNHKSFLTVREKEYFSKLAKDRELKEKHKFENDKEKLLRVSPSKDDK